MGIKRHVQRLLRSAGFDLVRFDPSSHPLARRKRLLEEFEINVVLDVGANVGQFGRQLRDALSYRELILSFEPLGTAFRELLENAKHDESWKVYNFGFGAKAERRVINVAGTSQSSSLLAMLPSHLAAAPESRYVSSEEIELKTIDAILPQLCKEDSNMGLKIDAQGFEGEILKGATNSLERIPTVQLEMSLVPLYRGELLFEEIYGHMRSEGYRLVAVEGGFSDPALGHLLQIDGIFHRKRR